MKAGALPVAIDTSVLVAALLSWHERHAAALAALDQLLAGNAEVILSLPTLVEAYSVMTRLPAPHRLRPEDAAGILVSSLRGRVRLATLDETQGCSCVPLLPCPLAGTATAACYPEVPTTLGEHVQKVRLDRGRQLADVTCEIGTSVSSLLNWEKGRAQPAMRFLPAILRLLRYDPRPEGQTFGEALRWAREGRGLSHHAFAVALGVDPTTILSWEKGRHSPSGRWRHRLREIIAGDG